MLEMILISMQNLINENVPKNVPKSVPLKRLDKTIKRDVVKLKEQNRLKRVGSLKSGYWEVEEEIDG
jgi:predicted HTH transcriptional regulator